MYVLVPRISAQCYQTDFSSDFFRLGTRLGYTSPNPWARFRIAEIAKRRLLEYCGSERIYILPCESSSFMILCALAFRTFCNSWKSFLYIRTVLVVIVGPYTFESRIHKVAVELPNVVEGLVGVQYCIAIPDAQNFYWKVLALAITKLQYLYTKESFWWALFNGNGWRLRIKSIHKLRPFSIFPIHISIER